jgi:hypothetical protein
LGQASVTPGQAGFDRIEQVQMAHLQGAPPPFVWDKLTAVSARSDPTPLDEGVQLGRGHAATAVPLRDADPFPFGKAEKAATRQPQLGCGVGQSDPYRPSGAAAQFW